MRPGFGQFNVPTDENLQYAAQFGATDVRLNTPQLPGGERWALYDLVKLRVPVRNRGTWRRSGFRVRDGRFPDWGAGPALRVALGPLYLEHHRVPGRWL